MDNIEYKEEIKKMIWIDEIISAYIITLPIYALVITISSILGGHIYGLIFLSLMIIDISFTLYKYKTKAYLTEIKEVT